MLDRAAGGSLGLTRLFSKFDIIEYVNLVCSVRIYKGSVFACFRDCQVSGIRSVPVQF